MTGPRGSNRNVRSAGRPPFMERQRPAIRTISTFFPDG